MSKNAPITQSDHEETYDEWFRRMVEEAVAEADSPDAVWVSHEEIEQEWAEHRAERLASIKAK